MAIATFSPTSLLVNCDDAFPNAGTIGYLTLLSGDRKIGLGYTVDAATNQLTTVTAHGLVTGSRVQLVDGVLPTPLLANTDYYAIVVSPAILSLGATLADAEGVIAVDLTDAGSGTLTLSELELSGGDPLSVLINKEISHPSWTARAAIDNLGGATIGLSGAAEKPPKAILINNTSANALTHWGVLPLALDSFSQQMKPGCSRLLLVTRSR
jgi:hypothetical protein